MNQGSLIILSVLGLLILLEIVAFAIALVRLKGERMIRWMLGCAFVAGLPYSFLNRFWLGLFVSDAEGAQSIFMSWYRQWPRLYEPFLDGMFFAYFLSFILFAAGFLILGMRTRRTARRVAELEVMAASMRAELIARGGGTGLSGS